MAGGNLPSGAYMLTVANKSLKQVPVTLSYYGLPDVAGGEGGYAIWGDVQVDAGIPVIFGVQGGQYLQKMEWKRLQHLVQSLVEKWDLLVQH